MDSPQPERICVIGVSAAALFALGILLFIIGSVTQYDPILTPTGICFALCPIIALASLFRISLSRTHIGAWLAASVLVPSAAITILVGGSKPVGEQAFRSMCTSNLEYLDKVIKTYSTDHQGRLPTASFWCDQILTQEHSDSYFLQCFSTHIRQGESAFAMNIPASDKLLSELPKDLVILFETDSGRKGQKVPVTSRAAWVDSSYMDGNDLVYKDCWNQHGGPELLSISHHNNGSNVLFADGSVRFVSASQLPSLRWTISPDPNLKFPPEVLAALKAPLSKRLLTIITVAVGALSIFAVCLALGASLKAFFTLAMAVISAVIGAFLGTAAENIFYPSVPAHAIGIHTGVASGIVFACLYGILVFTLAPRTPRAKSFTIVSAMITGALCSTCVHLLLMFAHGSYIYNGLVAGFPFGLAAGALLGAVTSLFFEKPSIPKAQND